MSARIEEDHGQTNAAGWASTIAELVAALEVDYDRLAELRDERESLAHDVDNADATVEDELTDAQEALADFDTGADGDELRELTEAATIEGDLQTDADAVRERIQESPLSVEVRSGWYSPGAEDNKPEEFCILLSSGGPALRILGELDEYGQPTRAWLEYQDWGTPWTEHYVKDFSDTLLAFVSCFYFGD